MIRLLYCVRKKPELTQAQFRQYWNDPAFDTLIQQVTEQSNALSHTKTLALQVEATARIVSDRGTQDPYDGVLEYWWENGADILDLMDSPAGQELLSKTKEHQAQFIDFSRSAVFFTESE